MKYIVARVEDWRIVARALVEQLKSGMVIRLSGPLGAGKTTFVQALALELGATDIPRSPTFSLLRTYQVNKCLDIKRLIHVDAYRLESSSDAHALGLDEELTDGDAVIAVEWPENLGNLLYQLPTISVQIETDATGVRRVTVS